MPAVHFDCHLMVTNPESYIEPLAKCRINCFTFHYEVAEGNLRNLCHKIKSSKIEEVGVSLKPATEVPEELIKLAMEGLVSKILVMTVEPGFGGQKFMEGMMGKVKYLREKLPEVDIQVDGGVGPCNIQLAAESGANCIVAGSSVLGAEDRGAVVRELKGVVEEWLLGGK